MVSQNNILFHDATIYFWCLWLFYEDYVPFNDLDQKNNSLNFQYISIQFLGLSE